MAIPSQLSRGVLRYYVNNVVGNVDVDSRKEMLVNLEDSKTVIVSYHADDPNVGMSLTRDDNRYKLFVCDTGLFVTLAFWDKKFQEINCFIILSQKMIGIIMKWISLLAGEIRFAR